MEELEIVTRECLPSRKFIVQGHINGRKPENIGIQADGLDITEAGALVFVAKTVEAAGREGFSYAAIFAPGTWIFVTEDLSPDAPAEPAKSLLLP